VFRTEALGDGGNIEKYLGLCLEPGGGGGGGGGERRGKKKRFF